MTLAEYLKSDDLDPIRAKIVYQRSIYLVKLRKRDYEISEDRLKGKIPEEYFEMVKKANKSILNDSVFLINDFKKRYNL